MQLNITAEVAKWLDEKRGERSRASFILKELITLMNNDSERQETEDGEGLDKTRKAAIERS